jgi:hypothetical protein
MGSSTHIKMSIFTDFFQAVNFGINHFVKDAVRSPRSAIRIQTLIRSIPKNNGPDTVSVRPFRLLINILKEKNFYDLYK